MIGFCEKLNRFSDFLFDLSKNSYILPTGYEKENSSLRLRGTR